MAETSGNSEITMNEIINKLRTWFKFFLSKWYLLLLSLILGGIIGLLLMLNIRTKYKAALTFVLSTESKGGGGGIAGLASQFGLDLGSTGSGDLFSGDNIVSLFQSQKMIKAVLFRIPPGSNDNLANIIIKDWKWDKNWELKSNLKNLIPFPNNPSLLNGVQDSLLTVIYDQISKNCLIVERPDKKLSVYKLSTVSSNEIFSCFLTKYLMDQTAEFYINTKTSIAKNNLLMLQREADSLRRLIGGTIVSNASEIDRTFNLNPALQIQRSTIQKGQVNATVLGTAYGEVVKNLELAKINLQKETPLYQIIDSPMLPLKAERSGKLFGIVIGGFVAFFLTVILLFSYFIFAESKNKIND